MRKFHKYLFQFASGVGKKYIVWGPDAHVVNFPASKFDQQQQLTLCRAFTTAS